MRILVIWDTCIMKKWYTICCLLAITCLVKECGTICYGKTAQFRNMYLKNIKQHFLRFPHVG